MIRTRFSKWNWPAIIIYGFAVAVLSLMMQGVNEWNFKRNVTPWQVDQDMVDRLHWKDNRG